MESRLLRLPEVCQETRLARSTLYKLIRAGEFPPPVKLTAKTSAWRGADIAAWKASRPVAPLGGEGHA